jgi:histidinol dehydrogenase
LVAAGDVDPRMAALDLIAQAEHDPHACTYLLTPDQALIEKINAAFEQELPQAGRAEIVEQAIKHTKLILVRDLDHAIDAVNDLAAEHVLLLVSDVDEVLPKVRNAGAVFLGHWTAVPYGDYGVASNHVLPTAGTARFSSGLRASDYVTVSSVIQMSPEAARRFTPGTSAIARAEGLVGHAKAMDARAEEAGEA